MAEVFYFHVQEDRSIKYKLLEPIMQEDKDVATWRFRIPKVLNNIDMSAWSWWFVYVNAKGQEYSELLTLTDDIDEPSSYSTADYDIDYGISKFPGSFSFALEAINAQQGGEISGEWHTRAYSHKVDKTLQGNQAEYAETESDVISALMQEVRNKVNQLVGGATPEPVSLIADMTDTKKVYLYVGSETGESTNYWYYYNGSAWVAGGLYAGGITVDSTPTQGSTNAVQSGGVKSALDTLQAQIPQIDPTLTQSGQAADAKVVGDEIGELNENLNAVATGDPVNVYPTFQLGYLHGLSNYTPANPAHNQHNDTVCATDYISVADAEKVYFDSSNYKLCICYYNENKEYQTYVGFVNTPNPYVLNTDYAYFVPELRKADSSAFSDDIPVDKLWYSEQVYNADIVRHGEFNNALASIETEITGIETEISNIGTKKIIHPDILPTLPYNVYRTLDGYMCDTPITGLDTSDWVTVYVDSANGNDSNNGDETHPVKTLTRADYLCRVAMNNGKKTIMQIADDSVFYIDDIPASYDAKKSYIIRAEHKATIFAGKKPTFTVDGGHYVSEPLTSYTVIGCVNTNETDDYGLFKPMTAVGSVNDVDSTDNSYYIDTTNKVVYVNPSSDINDIVVIFSNKYAMNPAARLFEESSFFFFENINFVGNSTATGRLSDTVGETIKRTIYVKNCIFQHGFSNNCVSFNNFDYTYIVDSTAGYAKLDCFNYHFTYKPTPTDAVVVEVNACGKEGGYYSGISGTSDQISTCHDGANILRCNTHGYNSDGSLIADVNGCYSVCLDCTVINTSYIGAVGAVYAPYRFDNAVAPRNGKTLLQNCYGYDSRNDKLITAIDLILNGINAGGSITATKISVGKDLI